MYDNTWFVSPLYILRCGRLVYRLEKLTLAKIDLKNRKSFMFNVFKQSFIYIMHNLYPYFDSSNSPKLYCFEITHTKQYYTIPKFSLKWRFTSDDRDLMRNESVEVCRVVYWHVNVMNAVIQECMYIIVLKCCLSSTSWPLIWTVGMTAKEARCMILPIFLHK